MTGALLDRLTHRVEILAIEGESYRLRQSLDAKTAKKMDEASKKVGEAKAEGAQEKRDADYKVAAEKCDAMAGNAKANCIAAAKAKFGKS